MLIIIALRRIGAPLAQLFGHCFLQGIRE